MLTLPSGATPSRLTVSVYGPGTSIKATVGENGAYEAVGVPPGLWKIIAVGGDKKSGGQANQHGYDG